MTDASNEPWDMPVGSAVRADEVVVPQGMDITTMINTDDPVGAKPGG